MTRTSCDACSRSTIVHGDSGTDGPSWLTFIALAKDSLWSADLRVLGIDEIKSVPCASVSHPFVERLIGTIRRKYLNRWFFWNAIDLTRKLDAFADYCNAQRVHRSLDGVTPVQRAGALCIARAALDHYGWQQLCRGLFQIPIAA